MWPIFNQICLHDKIPVKTLDTKVLWGFLVGEHSDEHKMIMRGHGSSALRTFPDLALCGSSFD